MLYFDKILTEFGQTLGYSLITAYLPLCWFYNLHIGILLILCASE